MVIRGKSPKTLMMHIKDWARDPFTFGSVLERIHLIYAQCIHSIKKKNLISKAYLPYLLLFCVSDLYSQLPPVPLCEGVLRGTQIECG